MGMEERASLWRIGDEGNIDESKATDSIQGEASINIKPTIDHNSATVVWFTFSKPKRRGSIVVAMYRLSGEVFKSLFGNELHFCSLDGIMIRLLVHKMNIYIHRDPTKKSMQEESRKQDQSRESKQPLLKEKRSRDSFRSTSFYGNRWTPAGSIYRKLVHTQQNQKILCHRCEREICR